MFARVRVRSVLAAMAGARAMVACREVASPDAAKPLNAVRHLSPKEGGGTLDDLFEAVDREVPGNFANGGDSGSPAFMPVSSEDDVYGGVNWLAGIVFAGDTLGPNKKDRFWFAPLSGIRTDLGSMTTVPGGGCTPNQYLTGCQ